MSVKIDGTLGIDKVKDGSIVGTSLASSIAIPSTATATTPATGTNNTLLATTAFAYGALSAGTSGYQKLPSGLIIQWGTAGSTTITFPISFPTSCLTVIPQLTSYNSSGAFAGQYVAVTSMSTTSFTVGSSGAVWIAIGY
jgi:hypothetical protein